MNRGLTPTTTRLPHLPLQSLFLLKWKWKPRSQNRTKRSSCGLAKLSVLYFCMDWYGKIWHDFVALGLCLLEQLKTWTLQRKQFGEIVGLLCRALEKQNSITSANYGKPSLRLRRCKDCRKRVIKIPNLDGTQARNTSILVCLLNDFVFCRFVLI